ncbi:hypothetical protein WJX77_001497 [Trebouxia sp. C0004]
MGLCLGNHREHPSSNPTDNDLIIKAWDTPAGLCKSLFYSCDDICTMQNGKGDGSIKLQQSGLITGIENVGKDIVNAFAGLYKKIFHKHVKPPPPLVIKEWDCGDRGECASFPVVE